MVDCSDAVLLGGVHSLSSTSFLANESKQTCRQSQWSMSRCISSHAPCQIERQPGLWRPVAENAGSRGLELSAAALWPQLHRPLRHLPLWLQRQTVFVSCCWPAFVQEARSQLVCLLRTRGTRTRQHCRKHTQHRKRYRCIRHIYTVCGVGD